MHLRELHLERGHQRLISGYDFGIGLQNGFSDIGFVRGDGRAIRQEHWRAINAVKRWSPARAIGDMTRGARLFGKEFFPRNDMICAPSGLAGEPLDVSTRLHDRDAAPPEGT